MLQVGRWVGRGVMSPMHHCIYSANVRSWLTGIDQFFIIEERREASPEQSLRPSQAPPVDHCEKFLMKELGATTTTGNNTMVSSVTPKMEVKHIDLSVESVTFSLSKAGLNAVMEKEDQMHVEDKRQIEKVNARNAVEEYTDL